MASSTRPQPFAARALRACARALTLGSLAALVLAGAAACAGAQAGDQGPVVANQRTKYNVPVLAPVGQSRGDLPDDCHAPLAVAEEVTRLLAATASHSTASAACRKGGGMRVSVDSVFICPLEQSATELRLGVWYRFVTQREGDTTGCGVVNTCEWLTPTTEEHYLAVTFTVSEQGAKLVMPEEVPGMVENATPLSQVHNGDCYGRSGAFTPSVVASNALKGDPLDLPSPTDPPPVPAADTAPVITIGDAPVPAPEPAPVPALPPPPSSEFD